MDLHSHRSPPSAAETADAPALHYPGPGKLFVIWTVVGILSSLRFQFQRPAYSETGQLAITLAYIASYYPWIAITPLVFRLERRFPLGGRQWSRNLGLLLLFSVPVSLAVSPLTIWLWMGVLAVIEPTRAFRFQPAWTSHFPFAEVVFWCSVAGGYFIRTLNQLRRQEQAAARLALEKSQLEAGLKEAQLDVLRARLNPHFLFNSLQNISVMTRQDPPTAGRMLVRLGDLLRAVLRRDAAPESTLQEEIELTRAYIALEQMRFGDRLQVSFDVAPEAEQALVPCFILQPLMENAVLHGLRGVRQAGVITVGASVQGRELVLTVTDNGVGPPPEALAGIKVGIGLGATRDRLAALYPDRHRFTLEKHEPAGTEVRIVIPLRLAGGEEPPLPDEQPSLADR